jgi:hypothetical protein
LVHQSGTTDGTNGLLTVTLPATAVSILTAIATPLLGGAGVNQLAIRPTETSLSAGVVFQTRKFADGTASASIAYDHAFDIAWQL